MKSKLFLSANQKKLLKERRRKKKQFSNLQQQSPDTTAPVLINDDDKDNLPVNQQQTQHNNDNKNIKNSLNESSQPNGSNTYNSKNKKRPRPFDENLDQDENNSSTESNVRKTISADKSSGTDTVVIIVPSNLSIKDGRKFRKDERRKFRMEGKDETLLVFLTKEEVKKQEEIRQEEEEKLQQNHKKKKQKIYPSINDLVANAKRDTLIQQQKVQNDTLSDEYTSKFVAIDCEMVGVGTNGRRSALARVSIVDWHGVVLLDTYVQVSEKVTDYRTWVSGIKAKNISKSNTNAMDIKECRLKVSTIIHNKILIGHAIKNDLDALMMKVSRKNIRDTSTYRLFQKLHSNNSGSSTYRSRKLKDLVKEFCNITIQQDNQSHDSIEDARGTMELFKMVHKDWEKENELLQTNNNKFK